MIGPADPENEHQAIGWKTFRRYRGDLESEYKGKYVLIHDEDVLGYFDDPVVAFREGLAKFPPGTFLVQGLGTPPIPDLGPTGMESPGARAHADKMQAEAGTTEPARPHSRGGESGSHASHRSAAPAPPATIAPVVDAAPSVNGNGKEAAGPH